MNNIETREQQNLIDAILYRKPGHLTHTQVGEILTLADEYGEREFEKALEFIRSFRSEKEGEDYKDELINKILTSGYNFSQYEQTMKEYAAQFTPESRTAAEGVQERAEMLSDLTNGMGKLKTAITKIKNMEQKTGAELIAQERHEQIHKHGWDANNDAYYGNGELLKAALFSLDSNRFPWPLGWSLHFEEKIKNKDRIGQLKVAGAFIAAEIDRQIQTLSRGTAAEESKS